MNKNLAYLESVAGLSAAFSAGLSSLTKEVPLLGFGGILGVLGAEFGFVAFGVSAR